MAEQGKRPFGVVIVDPARKDRAHLADRENSVLLRTSSGMRPLRLSTNLLCVGLPSAI